MCGQGRCSTPTIRRCRCSNPAGVRPRPGDYGWPFVMNAPGAHRHGTQRRGAYHHPVGPGPGAARRLEGPGILRRVRRLASRSRHLGPDYVMKPRPLAVRPEELRAIRRASRGKRHRLSFREGPVGQEEEPMHDWQNLSHVRWDCKYHVVIIPKYRRKVFYGRLQAADRSDPAGAVPSARSRVGGRALRCPTTFTCA